MARRVAINLFVPNKTMKITDKFVSASHLALKLNQLDGRIKQSADSRRRGEEPRIPFEYIAGNTLFALSPSKVTALYAPLDMEIASNFRVDNLEKFCRALRVGASLEVDDDGNSVSLVNASSARTFRYANGFSDSLCNSRKEIRVDVDDRRSFLLHHDDIYLASSMLSEFKNPIVEICTPKRDSSLALRIYVGDSALSSQSWSYSQPLRAPTENGVEFSLHFKKQAIRAMAHLGGTIRTSFDARGFVSFQCLNSGNEVFTTATLGALA